MIKSKLKIFGEIMILTQVLRLFLIDIASISVTSKIAPID